MRRFIPAFLLLGAFGALSAQAQTYTFFIRQVQMPGDVEWDVSVSQQGSQLSPLAINPNGARFELWAVKSSPLTSTLVDTTYVQSYVPVSTISITSEDPYSAIPRTRADRPFTVNITVTGLSSDVSAPDAAKSVKLLRHVQAYTGSENGSTINRNNATLYSQGSLSSNGSHTLNISVTSIPGGDRSKVKGEERFSIFSLADYQAPESQLASKFIQIWPVTSISQTGLTEGQVIKGIVPETVISLTDLYPESFTYAQVYPGAPQLGVVGSLVPGASVVVNSSVPQNNTIRLRNWDNSVPTDGIWTLEILTETPFGIDRLGYTTFTVDRSIKVNGSVTSVE